MRFPPLHSISLGATSFFGCELRRSSVPDQMTAAALCFISASLFARLDVFRERCRDILDFTRTIVQYAASHTFFIKFHEIS